MRNYEKELTEKIESLEMKLSKHEIADGLNMIYELVCEHGLENDPRYTEGVRKIIEDKCSNIELTSQLKARIWQLKDVIKQINQGRIGRYLWKKTETKQTF